MLKSVTTITVVNISIQLLGLISGVLVARMLGAEGRGELMVIAMWPLLMSTVGLLGVDIMLARKSPHYEYFDVILHKNALFFSVTLGGIFIVIGYFILPYLLSEDKIYLISHAKLFLLFIPSSMLTIFLYSIALGRGDIKHYNYFRLIFSPVYIILLLVTFMSNNPAIDNVINSFVVASTFSGFLVFVYTLKGCRKMSSQPIDKISLLKDGFPFGVSATLYSFSTHLPTILLAVLVDVKTIGLFAVASVVSTIHMPLGHAIGKVLFSDAVRSSNRGGIELYAYRFRLILMIYTFVALLSFFILPSLLFLLYGAEFSDSASMLDYLIPTTCVLAVTTIIDDLLKGQGISRPGIMARLIGGLVFIFIGFFLVDAIGIQGLLYALLVKSIIEFLIISGGLVRFLDVRYLVLFKYKMDDVFYFKNILKDYGVKI